VVVVAVVRYRCTVKYMDGSTIASPPFRSVRLCWWYAYGAAEGNEGINLLRDLQGRAEENLSVGFITGDHATYTVAQVTTD